MCAFGKPSMRLAATNPWKSRMDSRQHAPLTPSGREHPVNMVLDCAPAEAGLQMTWASASRADSHRRLSITDSSRAFVAAELQKSSGNTSYEPLRPRSYTLLAVA